MKNTVLAIITFGLLITSTAFSQTYTGPTQLSIKMFDSLSVDGPTKLKLVKADSMKINGSLHFSKIDIAQEAVVNGALSGDHGKFRALQVTGSVDVANVICRDLKANGAFKATYLSVNGNASIVGPMVVDHGKFQNLEITADAITLEDLIAQNIIIHNTQNEQILILKGASNVSGDITFDSGKGTVQIEGPSVQVKGNIKGATTTRS